MSRKSGISWTKSTWNPMVGCSLVSPGCTNCYAMVQAHSIAAQGGKAGKKYDGLTKIAANGQPVWNGTVRMADEWAIDQPKRWTDPRLIFVNSMSDWAHEGLSRDDVFRVLDVMMEADQHTYQLLTKRADRMLELTEAYRAARGIDRFRHLWFGVTVEDQRRADERMPLLAQVQAEVRFLSGEPLLGPLDLSGLPEVEWVIVGGESIDTGRRLAGDRARSFDVAWARALLKYCRERGIAFHFKQLGENPVGADRVTPKGDELEEAPADLQVREYPKTAPRYLLDLAG